MYSRERSTVILQHPVKKQIHILNEITTNSPKCIASVVVMLFCLVMSHYIRKHYTQYQLFSHNLFLFIYIHEAKQKGEYSFIYFKKYLDAVKYKKKGLTRVKELDVRATQT